MPHVLVLNGPNLNLLGTREPDLYGKETLADIETALLTRFPHVYFTFAQSNHEGELIDAIHRAIENQLEAIIINPGAYAHTSIALLDALRAYRGIKIEVHISNTAARESFRRRSYTASACQGSIVGLGVAGYVLATQWAIDQVSSYPSQVEPQ